MFQFRLPRVLLAAVLFFASWMAVAQVAVPPLSARVTDLTATLSADQKAALEQKLAAFEQKKGSQIAVLLVPSTQPESIEQYAIRVAEQWKIGRQGVGDGVILLIAKNDRALRIEVGRGLEGALPDAGAKRIVSDDIVPRFKQGDFAGGVNAGVERIIRVIDGEPLPPPRAANQRPGQLGAGGGFDLGSALMWGAFLVLFVGGILRRMFGRFLGSAATGGVAGWAATFLGAGIAGGVIAGVIVFIVSLIGLASLGRGGGNWRSGSGWGSGGWGGGGGWSNGGGSGGWSGGGGDFGGGGASGRW